MIPELGHLCLWLALMFALSLAVLPAIGVFSGRTVWMQSIDRLAVGHFTFAVLAFVALGYAFATDDFSVAYVASHSNSQLPLYYKLSAIWGAHEGSALLWVLMMAGWTLLAALSGRPLPLDTRARVLSVMGFLSFAFVLFSLTTSNPFTRLLPFPPAEGSDLNPQLQDFGLIVHPPMLYVGYIGFSVAFACAMAALWQGRFTSQLAAWTRGWVNVAWAFLGTGIVLGSWWAYYELGWGGWWFWDAVENASFMPWLVGAALLHSLQATVRRGLFQNWSLLLAIIVFSLSLLGTFLVRSGVLTSVHAFAVDPARGFFILVFLALVIGSALLLYALKPVIATTTTAYSFWSRENFFLMNNLLLVVATGTVLLGTLFPLAYEAFNDGQKLSVGPPYFNRVFLPLMMPLMALMAFAPFLNWQKGNWHPWIRRIGWLLTGSLTIGVLVSFLFTATFDWRLLIVATLAGWVLLPLIVNAFNLRHHATGMLVAHVGFAVCALGIVFTSVLSHEKNVLLAPGETTTLGHYKFRFQGVRDVQGPNYLARQGQLEVASGHRRFLMQPEKRYYQVREMVMTEAAIHPGFWRDLYIALGDSAEGGEAWSMRIQIKPFVRWIWLGGLMMALGALLAVWRGRHPDQAGHS